MATFFSSWEAIEDVVRIRIGAGALEEALAGRALVLGGRREGEVVVQVPGEWPVKDYYLEADVDGDELIIRSARRDDAYGMYEVSLYAVARWLRDLGLSPEVLER